MDQINHIGRPCDSELRFCGTAQRFWTQRPLSKASWLVGRRVQLFVSLSLSSPSRWRWQGRRRQACRQSQAPSIQRHDERDESGRYGEEFRVDVCQPGLDWITHSWAGLAQPEAASMRCGTGWWFGDTVAMEVPDSGAVW